MSLFFSAPFFKFSTTLALIFSLTSCMDDQSLTQKTFIPPKSAISNTNPPPMVPKLIQGALIYHPRQFDPKLAPKDPMFNPLITPNTADNQSLSYMDSQGFSTFSTQQFDWWAYGSDAFEAQTTPTDSKGTPAPTIDRKGFWNQLQNNPNARAVHSFNFLWDTDSDAQGTFFRYDRLHPQWRTRLSTYLESLPANAKKAGTYASLQDEPWWITLRAASADCARVRNTGLMPNANPVECTTEYRQALQYQTSAWASWLSQELKKQTITSQWFFGLVETPFAFMPQEVDPQKQPGLDFQTWLSLFTTPLINPQPQIKLKNPAPVKSTTPLDLYAFDPYWFSVSDRVETEILSMTERFLNAPSRPVRNDFPSKAWIVEGFAALSWMQEPTGTNGFNTIKTAQEGKYPWRFQQALADRKSIFCRYRAQFFDGQSKNQPQTLLFWFADMSPGLMSKTDITPENGIATTQMSTMERQQIKGWNPQLSERMDTWQKIRTHWTNCDYNP